MTIPYQDRGGILFVVSEDVRKWRITHREAAWRLESLDPFSQLPRFVGIYRSLAAAMQVTASD